MRLTAIALVLAMAAGPALADEVEDTLQAALEAWRAGDVSAAKEEVDYAAQLIAQQKAAGLSEFLPEPLEGWNREPGQDQTQATTAFGGGMMASALYTNETDDVEIQMMADNQMVTAMAGMFGNAALMGQMGKLKRINRQKVVITPDGEIQAMVANRILIQISGTAPIEVKEEYFKAIDLKGLADF